MPYANNQGIHIHYKAVGDGEPLVMQHGFYGSMRDWYEFGYVEWLKKEFRLILVDARGHGASDKPHNPEAYELKHRVEDIVKVLDQIELNRAHYLGYSMGGWIGFGIAKYAPARLNSLIIGGAQPYGRTFENARQVLREGIEAWVAEVKDWGPYSPEAIERIRDNDAQALISALGDRSDISDILPGMDYPCLLYAGSSDSQLHLMKKCATEMPEATLIELPSLNHIETFLRGDLVLPHIMQFFANQKQLL